MSVTPKAIAAAWATWKPRNPKSLGPGPAFREAIDAALEKMEQQGMNAIPEDLRRRSAEILGWKRTGILAGEALRDHARKLVEKFGGSFDMGQALSLAESETARELMELAVGTDKAENPAPVSRLQLKPLEWSEQHQTHYASNLFGGYSVWEIGGNAYLRAPGDYGGKIVGKTIEDGKLAAIRDIETRIAALLVDPPANLRVLVTDKMVAAYQHAKDLAKANIQGFFFRRTPFHPRPSEKGFGSVPLGNEWRRLRQRPCGACQRSQSLRSR